MSAWPACEEHDDKDGVNIGEMILHGLQLEAKSGFYLRNAQDWARVGNRREAQRSLTSHHDLERRAVRLRQQVARAVHRAV